MSDTDGGGGGGSGARTLVGAELKKGNPDWGCPTKGCVGCISAKTTKNITVSVRDTHHNDNPETCQGLVNLGTTATELEVGLKLSGACLHVEESLVRLRVVIAPCVLPGLRQTAPSTTLCGTA